MEGLNLPVSLIGRGNPLRGRGVLQGTEILIHPSRHKHLLECLLCAQHRTRHQKFKSDSDTVLK